MKKFENFKSTLILLSETNDQKINDTDPAQTSTPGKRFEFNSKTVIVETGKRFCPSNLPNNHSLSNYDLNRSFGQFNVINMLIVSHILLL